MNNDNKNDTDPFTIDARLLSVDTKIEQLLDDILEKEYRKCVLSIRETQEVLKKKYTIYSVPITNPICSIYNGEKCCKYIKRKLNKCNFYVRRIQPGNKDLFISWDPKHICTSEKSHKKETDVTDSTDAEFIEIEYDPNDPMSALNLTTALMKQNKKYEHLF